MAGTRQISKNHLFGVLEQIVSKNFNQPETVGFEILPVFGSTFLNPRANISSVNFIRNKLRTMSIPVLY